MRASLALLICSVSVVAARAADAEQAELKKLQGAWATVSEIRNGQSRATAKELWVFDGHRAKVHFVSRPHNVAAKDWSFKPTPTNLLLTYHFKLDPTQKPKALDRSAQYRTDKAPSGTRLAIYKLEGDTLTICFAGYYDHGKRPREFSAAKDSDRQILVLKRERR